MKSLKRGLATWRDAKSKKGPLQRLPNPILKRTRELRPSAPVSETSNSCFISLGSGSRGTPAVSEVAPAGCLEALSAWAESP